MTDVARQVAENVARVRARIAASENRCGRPTGSVRLVAVTKWVPEPAVRAVVAAGCRDLGESRPQELWERAERIVEPDLHWHLVGHLQRNKVRRTLPLAWLIHSVDSQRLLSAINEEAAAGQKARVLLEVNIAGESAKHGFEPNDLPAVLPGLNELERVEVVGLMGMAPLEGGVEAARRAFARLRQLRDGLAGQCPPNVVLAELSMGMSGDFEAAIVEGATIVRIGSALFAGVEA